MTATAKKTVTAAEDEPRKEEDITVERRSRAPAAAKTPFSARLTRKMVAIDQRLLAIARGEAEPDAGAAPSPAVPTIPAPPEPADLAAKSTPAGSFTDYDPFGGLIPVGDDEIVLDELDDDWVLESIPPSSVPSEPLAYTAVLRLCLRADQIVALPIDPRSGFLLSHIDGQRTVEEVIDASHVSASDALEIIGGLLRLGAIAVV